MSGGEHVALHDLRVSLFVLTARQVTVVVWGLGATTAVFSDVLQTYLAAGAGEQESRRPTTASLVAESSHWKRVVYFSFPPPSASLFLFCSFFHSIFF